MDDTGREPESREGHRQPPDRPTVIRTEADTETDERGVAPWRLALAGALALVLMGSAFLWFRCGLHGCPDVATLRGYMPDEASVVVDRNGDEISKLYLTRRVLVRLDSLPDHVGHAFVAIEDRRFWEHGGVDWRRVVGAMAQNVKSLEVEEGSSTITMQLARNVFPDRLPASQRTLWRKLGEARVARLIEGEYTKHEILELYLNQIYFGHGAYGIEAASQEYFGKPASELTLGEAALLAALPRAPSRLNPRSNMEAALEGRSLVLDRMLAQGRITADEAKEARESELELRSGGTEERASAPYFVEAVRRLLEAELGEEIYTGGYTIHTTLDLPMQVVSEEELAEQLRAIESGRYGRFPHPTYASVHADSTALLSGGTPYLQAALVLMDARSGDVLALVGGRDFEDSEFNRATQARRQPGSAFKPFVYAAALSAGYPPSYRLADEPIRMVLDNGRTWEPRNYDGSYAGAVSMRDGLVRSKNVVTVRLANEVGLGRVVGMAEQLLGQDVPSNPSVVLGTAEVTPIMMAAGYAAFATLGRRPEPRLVTRVEDRFGAIIWSQQPYAAEVLDRAVAFLTTNILEDVVSRGTATAVRAVGFRGPAAGKTGTTQDAADIWFVGYTPAVVGTVWLGFDKRQTVVRGATGGELAAPLWGRIMRRAAPEASGWEAPPGVVMRTVDEYGEVIADDCPAWGPTRREYFLAGTAPIGTCYRDPWAYDDSLGWRYDEPTDTLDDDGWWQQLRERVRRWRTRSDTLAADPRTRTDTILPRRDTTRADTLRRDTLRRDTMPRDTVARDTVRRDTVPHDTMRRDTVRTDTIATPEPVAPPPPARDTLLLPPDSIRGREPDMYDTNAARR